jgi:serine/threonine-protein kinase
MRLKHLQEIGSYELLERIGEGGMGEVWRAKHRLLARPAAIKLIRSDVLGSSQRTRDAMMRRFEREAKDTAMLGSTHTIDVYDFGVTEDGEFYYVMELLDGVSLERFVQLYGPMEPARVMYVLQQVCHSLGEAHSRGLVHRDIKPANIFICRLGRTMTCEGAGLRTGQTSGSARRDADGGRGDGGNAGLHGTGGRARTARDGRARRPLCAWVCGVLPAHRQTGVLRRFRCGDGARARQDEPVRPSLRSEFDIPPALEALILDRSPRIPPRGLRQRSCSANVSPQPFRKDAWTQERRTTGGSFTEWT